MTSLPYNPNLELLLPSSKSWAFYVHELTLTEGISQISTANLTLYSREFMDMDTLQTYLDMLATVKITQLHHNEKISRCFSGIITSVKHLGLLQENENGTVYGFHMTIQPILVNLCYARHNFSFRNITPQEAIQEILEGLPYSMEQLNEDNTPGLNTPSSFYQSQENDFQFLLRILKTYGINFSYYHPYTDDDPTPPILSLSSAGLFTVAGELYPTTNLDSPLPFHCRTRDEETYAMTQWQLSNEIGADAVKEDFQATSDQLLSHLSGDSNSKRVICFNTSPFGEVNKDNLAQISDRFLGGMLLGRQKWEGATASLEAMPGVLIDVLEFYGLKNNTCIPAQILRSELFCRAPMPDDLLQSESSKPAVFEIKLGCIDRTLPAKLETSVTELQQNTPFIEDTGVLVDDTSSSQLDVLESDDTLLLQAIVCDAKGNTSATNSFSTLSESKPQENGYTFTAKLLSGSSSSTPVDVWLVMPLGGFGQGLFRVPRQGEYILVAQNAGTNEYYLMGYLPNGNMPFASKVNYSTVIDSDTMERHALNGSIFLRFYKTDANSKAPDYLGDDKAILNKRVSMTSGGKPLYGEIAFLTNYRPAPGSKSNDTPSADEGDEAPKVNNDDNTGEDPTSDDPPSGSKPDDNPSADNRDGTPKTKNDSNAGKKVITSVKATSGNKPNKSPSADKKVGTPAPNKDKNAGKKVVTSEKPPSGSKPNNSPSADKKVGTPPVTNSNKKTSGVVTEDLSITSPNTITLTAGTSVSLNAPAITMSGQVNGSCANSSLNISCFEKENINANTSVVLTVGKTSVTASQDTIALVAARWSAAPGPFTSMIALTAMSGVVFSGMNVMMSGAYGMTITDGSGDSIKMGTGIITKTAAKIDPKTVPIYNYVPNNALTAVYASLEIAGFVTAACKKNDGEPVNTIANWVKNLSTIGMQLDSGGMIYEIYKIYKDKLGIKDLNIHFFQIILNTLAAILEQVIAIINPDWMSKPAGHITNRDCFRLTCMIMYTTAWIIGVIAGAKNPKPKTAVVSAEGDKIYEESTLDQELSISYEEDQSVFEE